MASADLRVVSLIPGATEIVAALGLTNYLVGRSHECDYPPEVMSVPACTQAKLDPSASSGQIHDEVTGILQSTLSIYQIDIAQLEALKPTHILTQAQCEVCAVSLADVEKAVAKLTQSNPQVISLQPNTLADLWNDIERVSEALGVEARVAVAGLQARVAQCKQQTQSLLDQPTVACIEWTEPLMVASNWIPELVNLAGGRDLLGVSGEHSPRLEWQALRAADPAVIIFMPCGFDLKRTRQEALKLTHHPEWRTLQAARTGKIYVTDGNQYFNRPGPRLVDSLEILAEILHPQIFHFGYAGTGWEPLQSEARKATAF
ncbi:MAG TPA: cobalamin-binding protein [Candidatus Caenarcaniphilales bacterium]